MFGEECEIRSDHKPLVRLLTTDGMIKASARIARMSEVTRLYLQSCLRAWQRQCYCLLLLLFITIYIIFFLSRLPLPLKENIQDKWDDFHILLIHDEVMPIKKEIWCEEYLKDETLQKIQKDIIEGWPSKRNFSPEIRSFWEVRNELSFLKGTIWRGDKAVPPTGVRNSIVLHGHEGHNGIVRTKQSVENLLVARFRHFY